MGIFRSIRKDEEAEATARAALKEARAESKKSRGKKSANADSEKESNDGALVRLVGMFRDVGIDGKLTFRSADKVAKKALGRGKVDSRKQNRAIAKVIGMHRRRATVGGFLTGLGGIFTLPILLPTNVAEFYILATRMTAAIASIRGYDVTDPSVRARVLTCLLGEESQDAMRTLGLGPFAGAAGRQVSKHLSNDVASNPEAQVANALGARIVRRFGLRSTRLFGKAIPGLGALMGAIMDRQQLRKIAKAAQVAFPA